jgi:hypothetical protein
MSRGSIANQRDGGSIRSRFASDSRDSRRRNADLFFRFVWRVFLVII